MIVNGISIGILGICVVVIGAAAGYMIRIEGRLTPD